MAGIGISEMAIIALLVLIFVGPAKLPAVARTMGRAMGEMRRVTGELKGALLLEDERPAPPSRQSAHTQRREERRRTLLQEVLPEEAAGTPEAADASTVGDV
jgi:sec-independent protein translocase protein TatB